MTPERKQWVKVAHSPTGTMVTVTLQQGNLSAKWTVKTSSTRITVGLKEALAGAARGLDELHSALSEIESA